MLDINLIRQQCARCNSLIHFNNAGCALSPDIVTETVLAHLRREQELGGYEAAQAAQEQIEAFYPAMAKLLHCKPEEIAFIENATRAWDQALYAIEFRPGDQILTCRSEYASNYLGLLHLARQKQLEVVVVENGSDGLVDLDQLEQAITSSTRLIALTHIASQRGDIQPAQEIGDIAHQHGLLYLLDACQSAGQVDLDVGAIGCDFLCGTGRKYLRGPRGTGFLFVNSNRLAELNPIFVDLHAATWHDRDSFQWRDDARRFENWERFVAGMIGLGMAVNYATAIGLPAIQARVQDLANSLAGALASLPGITVHERSAQRSGIVTCSKDGESAIDLQQRLQARGINTSVSRQANARLDLEPEGVDAVLRASVHYYNSELEIERFVDAIRAA